MPDELKWADISLDGEGSKKDEIEVVVEEENKDDLEAGGQSDVVDVDGQEEKKRETRVQRLKRQRDEERNKNAQLLAAFEELKGEVSTLKSTQEKALEVGQERFKETIQATRASLEREWDDAWDVGDKGKIRELTRKFAKLDQEEDALKNKKEDIKEDTKATRQPAPAPSPDPRAMAWWQENKWFDPHGQSGDPDRIAASAFALKYSERLTEDGYDPQGEDYYEELNKAVGKRFPDLVGKKEGGNPKGGKSPVAGSGRQVAPNSGAVKLTPDEVTRAQELGVSLKDFAKRKREIDTQTNLHGYTVIDLGA